MSDSERDILSRGLNFVPTKPSTDKFSTSFDVHQYYRRLRLAAHFGSTETPTGPATDLMDGKVDPQFPKEPSTWTPKAGEFSALERYIDTCESDIQRLHSRPLRHLNMSTEEIDTLKKLKGRKDIVIKPADKGGAVVVWRKDLYVKEAERQLQNGDFYAALPEKTTCKDNQKVKSLISSFVKDSKLSSEALSLVCKEPKEPSFYMLPKIHKLNNPGRPIVSACSCPTELISEFVDSVLQPLVASLPSYVKDTNSALQLLNEFEFDHDTTSDRHIFTMDVSSLYTNIPHNDGLLAIKHFLPKSNVRVDHTVVLRLAELVLTLTSFVFGGSHYQQT